MIPIPLLWILAIVVLGVVGSVAAFFLTQTANSLIMLAVIGLIVAFVIYPVAPSVIKKLRAHAEQLKCLQVEKGKDDEPRKP